MPERLFKIGDWQNDKKRWNSNQRAICNATHWIDAWHRVIRHQGVSVSSDGVRPLWWSHSAWTEMFFADDNRTMDPLSRQKCLWRHCKYSAKSVSRESQHSVHNFWFSILDNLLAIEHSQSTINLSAAFVGKNSSDDIASASYNWVPTEHEQFLWSRSTLHRNELCRTVLKLSFMRSVFAICPCK